jgi:hypothetical protein
MILKLSKFVLLVLVFVFIFGLFSVRVWDPDFWWHLKTGEYIYQTGSLPETDPFAFTSLAKDPLNPESKRIQFILKQYWGSQLLLYFIYRSFDFQGIIFMRAGLLTLLVFLLYRAVRREGTEFFSSIFLIAPAAVFVLPEFTGERPQLFSFLFSFLIIFLLEGYRRSSRCETSPVSEAACNADISTARTFSAPSVYYVIPIPFVMLLWANLHGGYIVGILIIAGYMVCETIKYVFKGKGLGPVLSPGAFKILMTVGLLSILVSFINPNGYNIFPTLIELQGSKYGKVVAEARSPFEFMSEGTYLPEVITYIILTVLCFLLMVMNIKRADITDSVIAVGLVIMSASASRALPFSVIFSSFLIARYGLITLRRFIPFKKLSGMYLQWKSASSASVMVQIAAVFLLIFLMGYLYSANKGRFFQKGVAWERYPKGAADFLKQNKIYGNMLNTYVWGGYLIWALYPDYKVFTDGRGLIEEVVFQGGKIRGAHQKILFGQPEWKALLYAYNITFIITDSVTDYYGNLVRLVPALIKDPEWYLIYIDNNSLIFVKNTPENSALIDRFQMPKEWVWTEVISEAASDIRRWKKNINFYITMGDAFLAMKKYQDAGIVFRKAELIDPGNHIIQQRLNSIESAGK